MVVLFFARIFEFRKLYYIVSCFFGYSHKNNQGIEYSLAPMGVGRLYVSGALTKSWLGFIYIFNQGNKISLKDEDSLRISCIIP